MSITPRAPNLDGELDGQQSGLPAMVADNNDVALGAEENNAGPQVSESFNGAIDEVRISNVARSGEWVRAQYRSMTDQMITYFPAERP